MTYPDGKSERVLYTPEIAENPQMLSLLTPFQNKGKAQLDVKIGTLNGRLEGDRSKVRFVQTNMGHLVLAAQMARTGADFGVMSGGGIRDSIEGGNITYKDVLKVQPFGNVVVVCRHDRQRGRLIPDRRRADEAGFRGLSAVCQRQLCGKDGKLNDLKIKGEPGRPGKNLPSGDVEL